MSSSEEKTSGDIVTKLRHVAGLSAGNTMELCHGRYEFGPAIDEQGGLGSGQPSVIGFELDILDPTEVLVIPKEAVVHIDGRPISDPTPIAPGQIIQAGADHFVIGDDDDFEQLARRTRAEIRVDRVTEPRTHAILPYWWVWLFLIVLGLLLTAFVAKPWIALTILAAVGAGATWLWQRRQERTERVEHAASLEQANQKLVTELLEARSQMARRCRAAHLSATELRNGNLVSRQAQTEKLDLAIGLGDVAWQPPVTDRENAGWDYHSVVDQYASLSAVPYVVDLDAGPVAIIGAARSRQALARYLQEMAVVVAGRSVATVEVSDSSSGRTNSFMPGEIKAGQPAMPLLVLADTRHSIPNDCVRILTINDAGFMTVSDAAGATLAADLVPNGLPQGPQDHQPMTPVSDQPSVELTVAGSVATDTSLAESTTAVVESLHTPGAFVASRIPEQQAKKPAGTEQPGVAQVDVDLRQYQGIRLYTSDDSAASKDMLAGIGLKFAEQHPPEDVAITVLDAGDRGLIRLRQLPHCVGYATIDDQHAEQVLSQIADSLLVGTTQQHVLLISEFPHLLAFLQRSGRSGVAEQLSLLASRTATEPLAILASSTTSSASHRSPKPPACDVNGAVAHIRQLAS